jgi:hypothetical protein
MFGFHRNPETKANKLRAMSPGDALVIPAEDVAKWKGAIQNARRSIKLVDHCKCADWMTYVTESGKMVIRAI